MPIRLHRDLFHDVLSPRMVRRRILRRQFASLLPVSFAGAVWGLTLARTVAEEYPASPTFELQPTLAVAALAAAATAAVAWWLARNRTTGVPWDGYSVFVPLVLPAVYLFWPTVAPRVGWTLIGGSLALAALLVASRAAWFAGPAPILPYHRLVAVLLGCAVLVLYLRTLGSTVGQADTFEFQVVAPTLGVAHPTGYPLFILSGKLFSLLPYGSVAWRINLTSAVFGVATVVCLYHLIYRLTQHAFAALLAALSLAVSRVFWSQAVIAEVYTLHCLFVTLVLQLLLDGLRSGWRVSGSHDTNASARHSEGMDSSKQAAVKPIYALSLLLGLALTNHLTTVLMLPAVVLTVLLARPRLSGKRSLTVAGLFLLGLSLYLYIYLRWPALHDGVWMSWAEFWRYITGQQFGGALRLDAWRADPTRYQIVLRLLREPFGWPGLGLGAVGLVWLILRNRRVALVTLVTFLTTVWYALSYYVPDVSVFMLPAHLLVAVWLGIGIAVTLSAAVALTRARSQRGGASARAEGSSLANRLLISCLALLPLALIWTNLPAVDQSDDRAGYAWGDRVLDMPLAPGAVILADSVRIAPLYYLQRIEGRRSDLDILVLPDEAEYRAQLDRRLAAGQTAYLARFLPGLEGRYHLRSLGPLTEVGTGPLLEPPPMSQVLGVQFAVADTRGGSIELLGLSGPELGPDGGAGLTLYWRADAPVPQVYHVRLRLVDSQGQVWWQDEGRHPANNYYPTTAWRAGEVVADYHEIPPMASDTDDSTSDFAVQVGMFSPFSEEGLSVGDGGPWFPLISLAPQVSAHATPVRPLRAQFYESEGLTDQSTQTQEPSQRRPGVLTLLGVDIPDVLAADTQVEIGFSWAERTGTRLRDASDGKYLLLTWSDRASHGSEALVLETWGWSRLLVQAPEAPGIYDLRLGVSDVQGRVFLARCGWLARPTGDCALATVRITAASTTALANFDQKILLLNVDWDVPALPGAAKRVLVPGQSIRLTVGWEALQAMEADYTVSVQLVGPDGRLHGQTDAWPVQGTLPTSQWLPGQRISDPYEVVLSPAAPPGDYEIGVVIYLLETQMRLSLVDEAGRSTGDIAWIGEFEVEHE